ncbi:BON domain-containing protein [Parablastomonas sp. CN1-191]|uniref:BON domain-containing protein n=1 Tax=Parablastomonas sp. CN1-191 TaxID=3400908 RepID=UPI003BF821C3
MTERYRRDDYRRDRLPQPQNYPDMPRQPEQFADYGGQQGEWHGNGDDSRTRWRDSGQSFRDDFDDDHGDSRQPGRSDASRAQGWNQGAAYGQRSGQYRAAGYGDSMPRSADRSSRGQDDYRRGAGNYRDHRGFLDRAGDEIASWFGDDDAQRRREQDHRGRGPSNYTRSDDRIREDVNDRLTDDRHVDASKITVAVDQGEVTLDGTVSDRAAKRRAEDCVDCISGVKHVQNNLRVDDSAANTATQTTSSWSGTTG